MPRRRCPWLGVVVALRWDDWAGHLGGVDPAGMATFLRCGMLFLDVPLAPWQRSGELFDRAGISWERGESADLTSRMPWLDTGVYYPPRPVDADDFGDEANGSLGAVWTPDAGYVDDPRLAAANLAWAAWRAGADFRYRQTVTGISRAGQRWVVHTGGDTAYEVDALVNATGPWSGAVNAMCGAATDFVIGTRPLRQEVHHLPGPAGVVVGTVAIYCDQTTLPGYYVAMGTSGNQFKNAPLVGDLMATIIDGSSPGTTTTPIR